MEVIYRHTSSTRWKELRKLVLENGKLSRFGSEVISVLQTCTEDFYYVFTFEGEWSFENTRSSTTFYTSEQKLEASERKLQQKIQAK
jgi:hypothetical protein